MLAEMLEKVRDLYDRPLWKDWLTWLTALAVVAGIASEIQDYDGSNPAATAIGLVLAIGFQFVFWGILPGLLRRWVRSRGN
jgi:hypothetical protein